ncbi:hypothetical protein WR25_05757 [Diploscapter pachys]|uniref:DUF2909 domain-containing protein n=4 Tax=cellular organisms TaxID=131567 RepID=A0A2A2KCP6_9BILA|nr:hypothetical protein WR25_05757 [Diploscapter pachys]
MATTGQSRRWPAGHAFRRRAAVASSRARSTPVAAQAPPGSVSGLGETASPGPREVERYTCIHHRIPRSFAMLKAAIVLMLLATIASLFSGLVFLVKDDDQSTRLLKALTVRVALATLTIALVAWGLISGQLVSHAPF